MITTRHVMALGMCVMGAAATTGCYDDFTYNAHADIEADDYGAGGYAEDDYPPDEFIVSAEPQYYEGRPAYFYHNRWYYRDGGRWGYYHSEPAALSRFRAQARVGGTTQRYSPWGHSTVSHSSGGGGGHSSSGHSSGGGHGGGGHR
jgi:hypothetical protein